VSVVHAALYSVAAVLIIVIIGRTTWWQNKPRDPDHS
jgi:hypothetical protein